MRRQVFREEENLLTIKVIEANEWVQCIWKRHVWERKGRRFRFTSLYFYSNRLDAEMGCATKNNQDCRVASEGDRMTIPRIARG